MASSRELQIKIYSKKIARAVLIFKLNDLHNRRITNFLEDNYTIMRLYDTRRLAMIQSYF